MVLTQNENITDLRHRKISGSKITNLARIGMTTSGARQVMRGQPITNPNDRRIVAGAIANLSTTPMSFGSSTGEGPSTFFKAGGNPSGYTATDDLWTRGLCNNENIEFGNQKITGSKVANLVRIGMTTGGSSQTLSGQPITNPKDRHIIAAAVASLSKTPLSYGSDTGNGPSTF